MATDSNLEHLFIEQAEYLDENDFNQWSIDHPHFDLHYSKLVGPGAKLIIGPRGSGKTTILLKAKDRINSSTKKCAVYINFKKSLSLEPFYRNNVNPSAIFGQWLTAKAILAILEFDAQRSNDHQIENAKSIINFLEAGNEIPPNVKKFDFEDIHLECEKLLQRLSKDRLIVFMDDAAHAFSPEQQRDFFDFFRSIKSKKLSPKAAIYPGVTVFRRFPHLFVGGLLESSCVKLLT